MEKEKAMALAVEYANKNYPDCDIVWYAGEKSGWHFVWIKNSSLPRYTGLGRAITISPEGNISKVPGGMETLQVSRDAINLNSRD